MSNSAVAIRFPGALRSHYPSREEFEALVQRYQDRVYNLALRMLGDPEAALDVTQEAFVKAFVGIRMFRGDSSFYTWLYRITVNLCRAESRRSRVRGRIGALRILLQPSTETDEEPDVAPAIEDPSCGPDESLETQERVEAVLRAVNDLEPDLKEVIILRDIDNLSYETIAETLRLPIGTVRSRLHRARGVLRGQLREWMTE